MKKQSGFTLIELIMVIVILGILAAVALPKFVDLKSDADIAAVKGVAGALSSAGTINYALRSLHTGSGVAVSNVDCTNTMANSLLEGGLAAGYNVAASGTATATSLPCKVTSAEGNAAAFTLPIMN